MTVTISMPSAMHNAVLSHLSGHVEQVGFFVASYDPSACSLELDQWRPMPPEAFLVQTGYHVTLRDEVRPEVIKWAWDLGGCLVEVHSHDLGGPAAFSQTDWAGLEQWAPHVRWRLRRRPYAAIVIDGASFDAVAWLGESPAASQVDHIIVDGTTWRASGLTLKSIADTRGPT